MSKRSERDQLFQLAFLISTVAHSILGTCDRLRVACGIIKDRRFRGVGFNGSVSGLPHCDDVGHLLEDGHCVRTIHAEENSIFNTDAKFLSGSRAIITATPCIGCVKSLLQVGVKTVDYYGTYSNSLGRGKAAEMVHEKGSSLEHHAVDWADVFQRLFDALARRGGLLYHAGYRLRVVREDPPRS